MVDFILKNIFGIKIEDISKEQAAKEILTKEIVIKWEPLIINNEIKTNIVDFEEIKNRRKNNKYL